MTSKEALSDLYFLAIGEQEHISKCKETIEKDLEVLEILKSCIEEKKDGDYITFHFSLCWYNKDKDNCEIYQKIKEWLEK